LNEYTSIAENAKVDLNSKAIMSQVQRRFTIADLKQQLEAFSDDCELTFGAGSNGVPLTFYRTKRRGEDEVQIEFNEVFEAENLKP
jgi:hypothetical protein